MFLKVEGKKQVSLQEMRVKIKQAHPQKSPVLPYEVASTNPYLVGALRIVVKSVLESQIHVETCRATLDVSICAINHTAGGTTYASVVALEPRDAIGKLGVEPRDDAFLERCRGRALREHLSRVS